RDLIVTGVQTCALPIFERQRDDVQVTAAQLLDVPSTPGDVTDEGVQLNVSVGIQYVGAWLHGSGAAAINNLMEDVATAEISRSRSEERRVGEERRSRGW